MPRPSAEPTWPPMPTRTCPWPPTSSPPWFSLSGTCTRRHNGAMRIATWNVNSVNARLPLIVDWFRTEQPDVAVLQEIKCVDEKFPYLEFESLGYNVSVHGQKSYNGVAMLSKTPLEDVRKGLPGEDEDDHARYIEAVVSGD